MRTARDKKGDRETPSDLKRDHRQARGKGERKPPNKSPPPPQQRGTTCRQCKSHDVGHKRRSLWSDLPAFPQGLLGRERPPPAGRVVACHTGHLVVPLEVSRKRGSLPVPPFIPAPYTRGPGIGREPQQEERDRGNRRCHTTFRFDATQGCPTVWRARAGCVAFSTEADRYESRASGIGSI